MQITTNEMKRQRYNERIRVYHEIKAWLQDDITKVNNDINRHIKDNDIPKKCTAIGLRRAFSKVDIYLNCRIERARNKRDNLV